MYTARKTDLGRLRKYHAELTGRYCDLLRRRRFADARAVHRLRTRVRRAILLKEEFRAAPA